MNNEKKQAPRCPYCDAEMRLEDNEDVLFGLFADEERMYWYQCNTPLCGIHSPAKHTKVGAYIAAMSRWQGQNRVLTLDEVLITACDDYNTEQETVMEFRLLIRCFRTKQNMVRRGGAGNGSPRRKRCRKRRGGNADYVGWKRERVPQRTYSQIYNQPDERNICRSSRNYNAIRWRAAGRTAICYEARLQSTRIAGKTNHGAEKDCYKT